MNTLKKMLGIVWLLLGPAAVLFLLYEGYHRIMEKPTQDVYLPWIIIIVIFTPIAAGMMLFGYYAMKGEYNGEN